MNKIAVVTDSNSGITQEEAKEKGIFVLSMPFIINDHEYFEGITLTQEEFYQKLADDAEVSTSQPSMEAVTKLWDSVLETYDEIIYIPMSSGLSGSCQTAMMLANDYDGKVKVVDNQRISVTQRNAVLDALNMVQAGKTSTEIYDVLMETKLDASIYVMVDTLKYLKKGGRLTPAVAALGTILRIKPVLQIQGEKLDTYAKARTLKQGIGIMLDAMKEDVEARFENDLENIYFNVAHTNNREGALELKEQIQEIYPGVEVYIGGLSLSVSCHIGPGCLAVALAKKGK